MQPRVTLESALDYLLTLDSSSPSYKEVCRREAGKATDKAYIAKYLADRIDNACGSASILDLVLTHQFDPFEIDLLARRLLRKTPRVTFLQFEGVESGMQQDFVSAVLGLSTLRDGFQYITDDKIKTFWNTEGVEWIHPDASITSYRPGLETKEDYQSTCTFVTADLNWLDASDPLKKHPVVVISADEFVENTRSVAFVKAAIEAGSHVVLVSRSMSGMKTYWDALCTVGDNEHQSPLNFKKNVTFVHPKVGGKGSEPGEITYLTLWSKYVK